MRVLGIDTSTPRIDIALVDGDKLLGEKHGLVERNRTGVLPLIDALFRDLSLAPGAVDAIAVGAGPGSFTGLRIGMATAKGIAFAAHRPLWAVSSLAALAHAELARDPSGVVVAVLDARRGEVYAGAYRRVDGKTRAAGEERVLPPSQLAGVAAAARQDDERVRYTGDALDTYPELGSLDARWGMRPTGAAVAQLALEGARADVLVGGAPSYIRPSEAEVKYPDGVPGALRKR